MGVSCYLGEYELVRRDLVFSIGTFCRTKQTLAKVAQPVVASPVERGALVVIPDTPVKREV